MGPRAAAWTPGHSPCPAALRAACLILAGLRRHLQGNSGYCSASRRAAPTESRSGAGDALSGGPWIAPAVLDSDRGTAAHAIPPPSQSLPPSGSWPFLWLLLPPRLGRKGRSLHRPGSEHRCTQRLRMESSREEREQAGQVPGEGPPHPAPRFHQGGGHPHQTPQIYTETNHKAQSAAKLGWSSKTEPPELERESRSATSVQAQTARTAQG